MLETIYKLCGEWCVLNNTLVVDMFVFCFFPKYLAKVPLVSLHYFSQGLINTFFRRND